MEIFDVLTYDNNVVNDVNITTDHPNWTEVNHFTTPAREAGKYKISMSVIWKLDTTTKSGMLRYSTDGGSTFKEFQSEPKDKTNDNANVFALTLDHTGGAIDVRVDMTRESGTNAMDCSRSEIIVERKN
jgi:hypothetical protein